MNEMLTAIIKGVTAREFSAEPGVVVEGDIQQPLQFTRTRMGKLSPGFQISDIGTVMPSMRGAGIKFKGILDVATLHPGVDHVTFYSQDGIYSACVTLEQAREFGILLYEQDGGPFPLERGGPFRLVTPGLGDLCANVKQVGRIVFSQGTAKDTRPPEACAE
jgi:2-dehydropantoate 2-reductase